MNAFTPDDNDFAYVSMGTNDDAGSLRTLTADQTEANLRWMAQAWIDAGHAANHFMISTLPPRDNANSPTSIPDRNTRIRALASDLGLAPDRHFEPRLRRQRRHLAERVPQYR